MSFVARDLEKRYAAVWEEKSFDVPLLALLWLTLHLAICLVMLSLIAFSVVVTFQSISYYGSRDLPFLVFVDLFYLTAVGILFAILLESFDNLGRR